MSSDYEIVSFIVVGICWKAYLRLPVSVIDSQVVSQQSAGREEREREREDLEKRLEGREVAGGPHRRISFRWKEMMGRQHDLNLDEEKFAFLFHIAFRLTWNDRISIHRGSMRWNSEPILLRTTACGCMYLLSISSGLKRSPDLMCFMTHH